MAVGKRTKASYLDVNGVDLGGVWSEGDQAAPATQHLHMVGHFPVIDADLQLSLTCLRCIHCGRKNTARYYFS